MSTPRARWLFVGMGAALAVALVSFALGQLVLFPLALFAAEILAVLGIIFATTSAAPAGPPADAEHTHDAGH